MKRPFFRTFFITVFHHRGFPRRRIVVPSFGKTFYCLPNYNYLFVFFPYSVFNEQSRSALRHPAGPSANHTPQNTLMRERLFPSPFRGQSLHPEKIRMFGGGLDRVTLRKNAYALGRSIPHPLSQMLVGLSGLEPPTSRLSGGCSNQLSYKPM